LFGRLASGGSVHVNVDDNNEVKLAFESKKPNQEAGAAATID
jgi:hypothetical protein